MQYSTSNLSEDSILWLSEFFNRIIDKDRKLFDWQKAQPFQYGKKITKPRQRLRNQYQQLCYNTVSRGDRWQFLLSKSFRQRRIKANLSILEMRLHRLVLQVGAGPG